MSDPVTALNGHTERLKENQDSFRYNFSIVGGDGTVEETGTIAHYAPTGEVLFAEDVSNTDSNRRVVKEIYVNDSTRYTREVNYRGETITYSSGVQSTPANSSSVEAARAFRQKQSLLYTLLSQTNYEHNQSREIDGRTVHKYDVTGYSTATQELTADGTLYIIEPGYIGIMEIEIQGSPSLSAVDNPQIEFTLADTGSEGWQVTPPVWYQYQQNNDG